jgi:glyoxylase-like metal-dependent hydrolase (beta-lactamase superfamily II)
MNIQSFTFNTFQENTYILFDETRECIIIDPGCYSNHEQITIAEFISSKGLMPVKLINTHCHIDHVLGNKFVSNKWNLDLFINKLDLEILKGASSIAKMYGFEHYEPSPVPKHFLQHGETICFGNTKLEILSTPGHAPGHICLYNKEADILIAGDLIFKGSVGRTDLPGGNHTTLMESIEFILKILPEKTQVYCGHGPSTCLEFEKDNNPFLR